MAHLRILFGARLRGWRNAWSRQAGARIAALAGAVLAVGAGAIGVGELAWEGLAAAPETVATVKLSEQPVPGENALEAAFWLSFLAASVLGFRVMEILFRRGDMKMLERLPLSPSAVFFERSGIALAEGMLAAAPLVLFFVPLGLHGYPWAALSASFLVVVAMFCTVLICIGANVYIGVQFGSPQSKGLGDAYGSSGGAFIYGPAAGMAASAIAVLVLKLAAGELLQAEAFTNAAGLGIGMSCGLAMVLFLTGLRDFRRGSHLVTAWFNEADTVGFEAVLDYQTSSWEHDGWERRLPGRASAVYRRLALELPRRHPLSRWLYGAGAAASLFGFWNWPAEAFPAWVPVAIFVAFVGLLSSPWVRARNLSADEAYEWFPISEWEERLAGGLRGGFETSVFALALVVASLAGAFLGGRGLEGPLTVAMGQLVALTLFGTAAHIALPYRHWLRLGRGLLLAAGVGLLAASFTSVQIGILAGAGLATAAVALAVIGFTTAPDVPEKAGETG